MSSTRSVRRRNTFLIIVGGLIVVGVIGSMSGGSSPATTIAAPSPAVTTPAAVLPAMGTMQRAEAEIRDKFGTQVVSIDKAGGQLNVGLKYIGKYSDDVNAKDAFRQVFKDAGWAPKEMLVTFHGTLVVKSTGAESDGVYAVYDLTREQAAAIVWANQDEIDWSQFRTMQRADI